MSAKYKKGRQVESLHHFLAMIEMREPFYWRHKFMAAGFIEHWSLVQVRIAIKGGVLYSALRINDVGK